MKASKKKNKQAHRPIGRAASSLDNKTGSWRTFRPEVDKEKCIGCQLCAKLCPDACISMQTENKNRPKAEIDYDYCKGCGLCAAECPVKAIIMKRED